jgi:hypothetical protein
MKIWLVTEAWFQLLYLDMVGRLGLKAIRRVVPPRPSGNGAGRSEETINKVVDAVSLARMLYVKEVFCLQNAAVVTRLLRRRGVAADLLIGCHLAPMRGHAWVEVEGKPVTEWQPVLQHYCILDRW